MTIEKDLDTPQGDPVKKENAEGELTSRRDFLIGLGKWSRIVIAGAALAAGVAATEKPAEAGWLNRRGGGGSGWINGGGGGWWNNRGGLGWLNRR